MVRHFDADFDDEIELARCMVMSPGIVYTRFHYDCFDGSKPPLTA